MNSSHHQGSVRCSCWHSSNRRIILSGGDDRTVRLWRLYPHNTLYQFNNNNNNNNNTMSSNISSPKNKKKHSISPKRERSGSSESTESDHNTEDDVELSYDQHDLSDDDDPNKLITDFDPSIQPLSHLLSMPASGEVKGLCMSPYNGEILVATSSLSFNKKSSLDILTIPHWTWNYTSNQRLPYKQQLREKYKLKEKYEDKENKKGENNLIINSLDDELDQELASKSNPFIENQLNASISSDFVNHPSIIPLPYGARERCITFSPSPNIVFVGLLSCRKKHQRRYCCLMACNILNGASRACKKINALLHRKECIYSIQLTSSDINYNDNDDNDNKDEEKKEFEAKNKNKIYRLALGTNLGRLIIVTLKQDLSWNNTRRSFITEYSIAFENDPLSRNNKKNNNLLSPSNGDINNNINDIDDIDNNSNNATSSYSANKSRKSKHHRKNSSKYSVLTARERCFREMSDPITVMITYDSMKKYLWNESSQIDECDICEFFEFMKPNKKNQITFTQFVRRVDEDGNFMRAFEQFCLTGSSRTDRRAWMDHDDESEDDISDQDEEEKKKDVDDDDSDWELAMLNNRGGDKLNDSSSITSIVWSKNDNWIITGHCDGDIRFWSKEYYQLNYNESIKKIKLDFYLKRSEFYYVLRGSMRRHCESISCLSLSGTYLTSSSQDGNILIWHLDFLLPTVSLPMNITNKSRGIIQLLATINSAHLGDEICDVKLSKISNNIHSCIPNALYLISCGADENIRCRDVMEILRQQLTLRILAESQSIGTVQQQQQEQQQEEQETDTIPRYDSYKYINNNNNNNNDDGSMSDGSDFGATTYN